MSGTVIVTNVREPFQFWNNGYLIEMEIKSRESIKGKIKYAHYPAVMYLNGGQSLENSKKWYDTLIHFKNNGHPVELKVAKLEHNEKTNRLRVVIQAAEWATADPMWGVDLSGSENIPEGDENGQ